MSESFLSIGPRINGVWVDEVLGCRDLRGKVTLWSKPGSAINKPMQTDGPLIGQVPINRPLSLLGP